MEALVPILLLATVFAFTNWLKSIAARDWNAVITVLVVWSGGFVIVWIAAQTVTLGNFAPLGTVPLKLMRTADLFFIGLNIGSGGVLANEFKKAFDRSDTATTPPLVPSLAHPVRVVGQAQPSTPEKVLVPKKARR
jgi:hypothetical protein